MNQTESMKQHRAEREAEQEIVNAKAASIWATLTKDQKTLVRFGMFPAEVMAAADAEGFTGERSHALTVALMECATKNGGMRA